MSSIMGLITISLSATCRCVHRGRPMAASCPPNAIVRLLKEVERQIILSGSTTPYANGAVRSSAKRCRSAATTGCTKSASTCVSTRTTKAYQFRLYHYQPEHPNHMRSLSPWPIPTHARTTSWQYPAHYATASFMELDMCAVPNTSYAQKHAPPACARCSAVSLQDHRA
jgi:hypothetical protein